MLEPDLFMKDMSDFLAEPDNSFQIEEENILNFCVIYNYSYRQGTFTFNLHY